MTADDMSRKRFFTLLGGLTHADLGQIQDAYWLAKNAHRPQMRDDGSRYFEHPRRVAVSLIERGFRDVNIIVCGLLHDVVEDTNTPLSILVNSFPNLTWEWLYLLSKSVPFFDPVTGQLYDRIKKPPEVYFAALASAEHSPRLVKLADRLDNFKTIGTWKNRERLRGYLDETRQYILPIARRTDAWFAEEIEKAVAIAEQSSILRNSRRK